MMPGGAMDRAHSIVGDHKAGRPDDDFYATPPEAVDALLSRELWSGVIWEPACGDGAISKRLEQLEYQVYSSDFNDHGYGQVGVDFLDCANTPYRFMITNPPYNITTEWIERAHDLRFDKFALLLKLSALEGDKRSRLMERTRLSRVWVFRKRLTLWRNGKSLTENKGMIAFAWFVWDRSHVGDPSIGWI
ncbi:conserved hypothetical protein [Gammaproteobacteria bacterium]